MYWNLQSDEINKGKRATNGRDVLRVILLLTLKNSCSWPRSCWQEAGERRKMVDDDHVRVVGGQRIQTGSKRKNGESKFNYASCFIHDNIYSWMNHHFWIYASTIWSALQNFWKPLLYSFNFGNLIFILPWSI